MLESVFVVSVVISKLVSVVSIAWSKVFIELKFILRHLKTRFKQISFVTVKLS